MTETTNQIKINSAKIVLNEVKKKGYSRVRNPKYFIVNVKSFSHIDLRVDEYGKIVE